jgi:hypothetical protein
MDAMEILSAAKWILIGTLSILVGFMACNIMLLLVRRYSDKDWSLIIEHNTNEMAQTRQFLHDCVARERLLLDNIMREYCAKGNEDNNGN